MPQTRKANAFTRLHVPGDPLILYNVWDVATARAVEKAGAEAIATASHAVAEAHGYEDGENAPLDFVLPVLARIAGAANLPVTMDAEGGYGRSAEEVARHVRRYIEAGAVGVNFEDSVVGTGELYGISEQSARITAIRKMADDIRIPIFINARTDVFLRRGENTAPEDLVKDVLARGEAYAAAGASGLFVPGVRDLSLLERICREVSLPVNVFRGLDGAPFGEYASAGVARISHGPGPFNMLMKTFGEQAAAIYG